MLSLDFFLYFIAIIVLIIGSIEDFKKREIPDYLNYFFVISLLGLRLLYSIFTHNYIFFLEGVLGFLVFFLIAIVMYQSGQWGGGDSKMLLGLGAFFGLSLPFKFNLDYFKSLDIFNYFILMLLVGAVYAICWTFVVSIIHRKKVFLKFKEIYFFRNYVIFRRFFLGLVFLLFMFSFFSNIQLKILIFTFIIVSFIMYFLFLLLKAVEGVAMIKTLKVSELTEGDWVVDTVYHGKTKICGPDDLGLSLKQIDLLKKYKIKKVIVKQGIPFVPSFFVAFLVWMFFL